MLHKILMKISFYKWYTALKEIANYEMPPADSPEEWTWQDELYHLRNTARKALNIE